MQKVESLTYNDRLLNNGFVIIEEVYTKCEIDAIIDKIDHANSNQSTFNKSAHLYAIRQFLKIISEVRSLIFNDRLKELIAENVRKIISL